MNRKHNLPRLSIARRIAAFIGAGFAIAMAAAPASAIEQVSARGSQIEVIDGDSVQIGGRVIDLLGVDAPEIGQLCAQGDRPWTCGMSAAQALRKILRMQSSPVVCSIVDRTATNSRGICSVGEEDLALALVRNGSVTVDPRVAAPTYLAAERTARQAGLGVWGSAFVAPAAWRQGKRLALEDKAEKSTALWDGFPWKVMGVRVLPVARSHEAGCLVKASDDAGASRAYLTPMDPGYRKIASLQNAHLRTYCSDDEARAAGWRHAGELLDTRNLALR